ncbi:PTS system glucose-specific IIA component [Buchnera aphidicola str. Bp (Baizongia pistaciae)]|uniref:PTS system glucose-specific EIIA component n=1 Tax=Buchnera aphidicola subsp. Baizongia pistaciae (strain Bp) TaxID=224915 RepID=PTGA_BUCBP|nr:PTS glucose transporter subunit IIA [Buchnera aphidicola]Q89B05.1 RecName: Full=PTS system glucose-specific EIIA component; AltName: Full=EIIA-Glc; AltName: Full=EIII-Glc; AltName: Full=Glucose-specific phosphotransferase enzyme IIA component [Buchnera aphidicola str. Bp (Baizongia pistaciae)]AAO26798.1 PTS system glucose-specific IIA component [Buchnera aphidicola str. Bp (Baizongia pistaciae)]
MKFFSNFFKNKNNLSSHNVINIFAPISGDIVEIESVPDEVFSNKIVGDGIAISPNSNILLAPINGTIGRIFETLHAFSIKSDDDIELFVHFGIDTVKLKGRGFKKISEENIAVKIGDPIIFIDLPFLKKLVKSTLTPVIISNIDKFKKITKNTGSVIAGKTVIFSVQK